MTHAHQNLVLIGMPGAGKSTVGVILAKQLSLSFIDTDVLIQTGQQRSLQEIVDTDGYMALREIEEEVLLGLAVEGHVIATGGSAVYSEPAMQHLKSRGTVVFLDVDEATLRARVSDFSTRGLAKPAEQSFRDLLSERLTLYRRYADLTIACSGLTQEDVCTKIVQEMATHALG